MAAGVESSTGKTADRRLMCNALLSGVFRMSEFQRACAEKDFEIDYQAAKYVRSGMPPWDAYKKAARNVRQQSRRIIKIEDLLEPIDSDSSR